jgi:hypothetical protein
MSDYFPKNRERGNLSVRRVVFGIGKRSAKLNGEPGTILPQVTYQK